MKLHFGVKLAGSYFPSMRWIGANPKSEGAVSLSEAHKNCRPSSVNNVRAVVGSQPVRKPSTVVVARPLRDIYASLVGGMRPAKAFMANRARGAATGFAANDSAAQF